MKKGGILLSAYISKFYVFPFVALNDTRYLSEKLYTQLVTTGVLKQEDPYCFWTDSFYTTPDEMECFYKKNKIEIIDHFAQDGISPVFRDAMENLNEEQFRIWCDYHYTICREKSILGLSNHIVIAGRK